MHKIISALLMTATLLLLSACATSDPSGAKASYKMIDAQVAKTLHDRGAVFIDVRIASFFADGHIPGAVNIPISKFNGNTLSRAAARDQEIVIYCYGIHCDYSSNASSKALTWGYQSVYYFMKGYPAWEEAGYSVEL